MRPPLDAHERALLEIVRLEAQRIGLRATARRLGVGSRALASALAGLGRAGSTAEVIRAARRAGLGVEP